MKWGLCHGATAEFEIRESREFIECREIPVEFSSSSSLAPNSEAEVAVEDLVNLAERRKFRSHHASPLSASKFRNMRK